MATALATNTGAGNAAGSGRVEAVQSLRGLAALAVAIYHFSHGNPEFYVPHAFGEVGRWGWLGVEVFFVISGFILPYSLWQAGYRLSALNFRRFVGKRVVRLDPPYFCTIGFVLLLQFLSEHSPGFHGTPSHLTGGQLAAHVGYLNDLLGLPWLNPAFWTLAIECQFYLLIALIFPLLTSRNRARRLATTGVLLAGNYFFPATHTVVTYFGLFACGITAFQCYAGIAQKWEALVVAIPTAIAIYFSIGAAAIAVSFLAALVIVTIPSWTSAPLAGLGTLSYSLYLLHVPIGGRVINLAQRLRPSAIVSIASIATAVAVSMGVAYVLYRYVEKPSQRYAASIRFDT